jgi:GT2 family glycosyltransferase
MDISIIIVNWNTKALLQKCLDSVYSTMNDLAFEIIVIDNASTDDSIALLEERYPQIIKICNQINRGFGGANNQGFSVMKGKYALLLNTDAVLTSNAVNKLWSFSETHPQAAIVCGQLLNADGSKQNSVAAFPSLLTLAVNNSLLEYLFPKSFPSKRYEHKEPLEVDSAIGACMLIRRQALDKVCLFDERYFFFFEETDLAYALRRAGWKIYQVPDAFIYHLQGQSIGHNIGSRIEFYRSRDQFLRKWHSPFFYYSASGLVLLRLLVDWLVNFAAVIFSLGLVKNLRQKLAIYSQLIFRHFHKTL